MVESDSNQLPPTQNPVSSTIVNPDPSPPHPRSSPPPSCGQKVWQTHSPPLTDFGTSVPIAQNLPETPPLSSPVPTDERPQSQTNLQAKSKRAAPPHSHCKATPQSTSTIAESHPPVATPPPTPPLFPISQNRVTTPPPPHLPTHRSTHSEKTVASANSAPRES